MTLVTCERCNTVITEENCYGVAGVGSFHASCYRLWDREQPLEPRAEWPVHVTTVEREKMGPELATRMIGHLRRLEAERDEARKESKAWHAAWGQADHAMTEFETERDRLRAVCVEVLKGVQTMEDLEAAVRAIKP